MRDEDRVLDHERFLGMRAYDGRAVHLGVIGEREGVELGAEKEDVIPRGEGELRPHGAADALPGERHLVDVVHVPDGGVRAVRVTGVVDARARGARLADLDSGDSIRGLAVIVEPHEELARCAAHGAGVGRGVEGPALPFLVVDVSAHETPIPCHDGLAFDGDCRNHSMACHPKCGGMSLLGLVDGGQDGQSSAGAGLMKGRPATSTRRPCLRRRPEPRRPARPSTCPRPPRAEGRWETRCIRPTGMRGSHRRRACRA